MMHLYFQILATIVILFSQPIHAHPCISAMHRNTRRSANTATSFLDPWIGTLYNGLNSIRLTAVTDTPLRLRQVLNNAAQAKANSLCAGGSQQKLELSNFGVDAENAQTLVLQNQQSANDAVDMWAKAKLGKDSPLSAIMNSGFVYAGVGMCKDNWVAVLTSEFI